MGPGHLGRPLQNLWWDRWLWEELCVTRSELLLPPPLTAREPPEMEKPRRTAEPPPEPRRLPPLPRPPDTQPSATPNSSSQGSAAATAAAAGVGDHLWSQLASGTSVQPGRGAAPLCPPVFPGYRPLRFCGGGRGQASRGAGEVGLPGHYPTALPSLQIG